MSKIKNCPSCQKSFGIFRWRYTCDRCKCISCDDCGFKDSHKFSDGLSENPIFKHHCISCGNARSLEVKEFRNALQNITTVKSSHIGNHEIVNKFDHLVSDKWCTDPKVATNQLKSKALKLGSNAIIDFAIKKDTHSEPGTGKGTHYYSVFKASGQPVKVKKIKYNGKNQNDLSSELAKLHKLFTDGVLTQEEFSLAKLKLISN